MAKKEEDIGRQSQPIIVYQFNDEIGNFEELILEPNVQLKDLLDDDFILLFVDPEHYRVWLWHGYNTTTRTKFIAAKIVPSIRDKNGIEFKITAIDQDNEPHAFLGMLGSQTHELPSLEKLLFNLKKAIDTNFDYREKNKDRKQQ